MTTMADLESAAPSAEILLDGYDVSIDDQGVEASMRFWVAGSDVAAFRSCVAGLPATTLTINGTSVTRLVPLAHPYEYNCYAYSLRAYPPEGSIAYAPGGTLGVAFTDFFVDVRFRTPKYDYSGSYPTVTISRDVGIDMVTRPGSAYKFPTDNKIPNHDVGVQVFRAEYSLSFDRLPTLNNTTYDSLAGSVNDATFFGYGAGTVLYLGCSSTGQFSLGGVPSYQAVHRIAYRKIPHNQIMRPDGSSFEAPVEIGHTSKYIYPVADLSPLYQG